MGRTARAEFTADLRYIARERRAGAQTVLTAINAVIRRLRLLPELGHPDPDALATPPGTTARRISSVGYVIRYLYPVRIRGSGRAVLIVSIRHGARLPVGDEEFLRRYAQEEVRIRQERE